MGGEAGKGHNKLLHRSPQYFRNFDNIDWGDCRSENVSADQNTERTKKD